MEYTDRLRLLALNDSRCAPAYEDDTGLDSAVLDPKTIALIRLAALVAVGGAVASYGALANAAVDAGGHGRRDRRRTRRCHPRCRAASRCRRRPSPAARTRV